MSSRKPSKAKQKRLNPVIPHRIPSLWRRVRRADSPELLRASGEDEVTCGCASWPVQHPSAGDTDGVRTTYGMVVLVQQQVQLQVNEHLFPRSAPTPFLSRRPPCRHFAAALTSADGMELQKALQEKGVGWGIRNGWGWSGSKKHESSSDLCAVERLPSLPSCAFQMHYIKNLYPTPVPIGPQALGTP